MKPYVPIPNEERAVVDGTYVIYVKGQRKVVERKAGEPLKDGWKPLDNRRREAEALFR